MKHLDAQVYPKVTCSLVVDLDCNMNTQGLRSPKK